MLADARVRGAASLATGGMLSSILALVMLPLVTHFYSPEVYAQFAIVLTVTIILATVATGKYEQAIPLCRHSPAGELEAWQLARLATGVASIVCLALQALTVGVVLLFDTEIPGLDSTLLATPVLVMLGCLGVIQSMILTRQGRYKRIAVHQTVRICVQFTAQAGLGAVSPSEKALIAGFALSMVPSSLSAMLLILRGPSASADWFGMARSNRNFPLHQAPTALIRAMEANLSLLVIAVTYGDYLTGLYAVALRLVVSPAVLVASSVNTVYLREGPRLDGRAHRHLYNRSSNALVVIGVALTALLGLAASPIVDILGPDWQSAKAVIYASLPLGLATYVGALPSSALLILRRTRELLVARLVILLVPNAAILGCFWAGASGVGAVSASSLVMLVCVVIFAGIVGRNSKADATSTDHEPVWIQK